MDKPSLENSAGGGGSGSAGGQQRKPVTFEAALEELETIVARMEGGEVSLDESLRLYERGTFLIRHCQQRLDTAEKQIERLTSGKDGRLERAGGELAGNRD